MKLRYFEHSCKFVQKVKFTKPNYVIDVYLEYGACNEENCLPPSEVSLKKSGKSPAVDAAAAQNPAADAQNAALLAQQKADSLAKAQAQVGMQTDSTASAASTAVVSADVTPAEKALWWKPVVKQLQQMGGAGDLASHSLLYIFLMGLVGGLLALVMPCIWPIIPMTVSFFLKRAKDDRKRESVML